MCGLGREMLALVSVCLDARCIKKNNTYNPAFCVPADSYAEKVVRERFARAVARGLTELKIKKPTQSPINGLIQNAVIEVPLIFFLALFLIITTPSSILTAVCT